MISRLAAVFKKNCIVYLITCAVALVLNILYRSSDASLLTWILAPTARWAGILGGFYFEPFPGKGYVNETFHFLIAPSCSGIRFLQVVLLMLVFSYTHNISAKRLRALWLPFCAGFSYAATILINGLRIALSIYLPLWLENIKLPGILTPETLHTLIGATVYFSSLLMLQPLAHAVIVRLFLGTDAEKQKAEFGIAPAFWYFTAVLGLPFAKRLITGNMEGFGQYALIIALTCGGILLLARCMKRRV